MERTIKSINPIDEDEWGESVQCMSELCTNPAVKEVQSQYPDDENTYYTCLCRGCVNDYSVEWESSDN